MGWSYLWKHKLLLDYLHKIGIKLNLPSFLPFCRHLLSSHLLCVFVKTHSLHFFLSSFCHFAFSLHYLGPPRKNDDLSAFFWGGETIQHIYKDIMKRCARGERLIPTLCGEWWYSRVSVKIKRNSATRPRRWSNIHLILNPLGQKHFIRHNQIDSVLSGGRFMLAR